MLKSSHWQSAIESATVLDVCIPEIIDYDSPEDTIEWKWLESRGQYPHRDNNTLGIWEFFINLHFLAEDGIPEDTPKTLVPILEYAKEHGFSYILAHQGT